MKARHLVFALALVVLAGCARHSLGQVMDPPGFLAGLLHGVIAPFAFVGSLFSDKIEVYAFPNAGGWYDFGFLLGIGALGGGGGAAARRR